MEELIRKLERQWHSTGSIDHGVEYLLAASRAYPIDLADFPPSILLEADLTTITSNFRNKHLLYGVPIAEVLVQLENLIQPYWELLQVIPEGVPAFDRIPYWFAANNLPAEQAAASQNIVGDIDPDDYEPDAGPEYDVEDYFNYLFVWYPLANEIRVFVASQYAETYGDIRADFSEGYAQVPRNIPQPMGILREFTFRLDRRESTTGDPACATCGTALPGAEPGAVCADRHIGGLSPTWCRVEGWRLVGVEIIAHVQGLWSNTLRPKKLESLILTSRWYSSHIPLVTESRRNYFILLDEITTALPLNVAPSIERGYCEDFPACGHDSCPPLWSHTGQQVGMICAICGGEMALGRSSIHPACMRRSMIEEDPYYEEEEEEEEEDEDEDDEDDY